jgi:type I restriction enzyme S subunit
VTAIKQKLIREPRKELAAVSNGTSPFQLPHQWEWARLGEVIYIQSGDGLTAANMKDGSIPVFGGNGINGHHDTFNVDTPTIVIGRVGYYCGSIHITPEKAWITDNAFVTHFCPALFSLHFLSLLLATTNLKENEGATAQPVISGSKIYPLIVAIPPLAEQNRIVAKVDELMALCDQLEAQLSTTRTDSRRLLESVLDAALVSV